MTLLLLLGTCRVWGADDDPVVYECSQFPRCMACTSTVCKFCDKESLMGDDGKTCLEPIGNCETYSYTQIGTCEKCVDGIEKYPNGKCELLADGPAPKKSNTALIVGLCVGIGGAVIIAVVIIVVVCCCKKKKKRAAAAADDDDSRSASSRSRRSSFSSKSSRADSDSESDASSQSSGGSSR
ncbi:hypothetical protein AGDE_15918 [Angomonas deanei]|uniref:Orthoreovirus membrane fusion protein p10, putative n=1 Tax=Angomonas deanei TaxID=59799 RepID=A0A7G2CIY0_9TRYP|nr:hypothetical protein AGDE_15918 [Angomonas deanei]CAD2219335.1 Orthoreovirus membrane fusion protein p10, putative [Angomonas deanei]|eukprot:EPY18148.1 hypothetical protein AGDE_15918 [Angomonas deanei]